MRLALILLVFFALAVPAQASAPTTRSLQRQVTALQKQVRSLQLQINALVQQTATNEQQLKDQSTCFYAVGSDNLNGVWHTVNLIAQYLGFPAQPDFPKYDDQGACDRQGVVRSR